MLRTLTMAFCAGLLFLACSGTNQDTQQTKSSSPSYTMSVSAPHFLFNQRTAEKAVERAYNGILHRNSDPDGLRFHASHVHSSGFNGWKDVLNAMVLSSEFTNVVKHSKSNSELLSGLYHGFLGRDVDPTGEGAFLPMIERGQFAQVVQIIASSDEFFDKILPFPTRAYDMLLEVVNMAYHGILNRSGTDAELSLQATKISQAGIMGWIELLDLLTNSNEFRTQVRAKKNNRNIVEQYYLGFLGRAADEGGATGFVSLLNQGKYTEVAVAIGTSDEFFTRVTPCCHFVILVRDQQGHGIGGATVTVDGNSSTSSIGDGYTYFYVNRGTHNVVVEARGYETRQIQFDLTVNTETTIQLTRKFKGRTGPVRASGRNLRDDQGEFVALGATFMWGLWGLKYDRVRMERNLEYLAQNGFDYVRVLGTIGKAQNVPYADYWHDRWITSSWPNHQQLVEEFTDLAYDKYGLRVEWTIFGGSFDYSESERVALIDRFLQMSRGREQKIMHFEVANEYWQTGFQGAVGRQMLRRLTQYMNNNTDILVAASSPGNPEFADWCAEFVQFAGAGDIGTWHFDRDVSKGDGYWRPVRQPWDYQFCAGAPLIGSNNEPIGPGASVVADENPVRMISGALNTYLSGLALYVYHSDSGIRGYTNFYDYAVDATLAYRNMKSYLPIDVAGWNLQNHHWSGHPFVSHGEVGYPPSSGSGAVRFYGATSGNEFFANAIGLNDYLTIEAKDDMDFEVIEPVSGNIRERISLRRGERFNLRGGASMVVKGRFR